MKRHDESGTAGGGPAPVQPPHTAEVTVDNAPAAPRYPVAQPAQPQSPVQLPAEGRLPAAASVEPRVAAHTGARWNRRNTWILLVAASVGAGWIGGALTAFAQPPVHAARAEIVYPIGQELPTGFLRQDRALSTQLVLIRSRAVLGPVAEGRGLNVDTLRKRVSASVLADSEVLRIQVRDGDPAQALAIASATAQGYLQLARAVPNEERTKLEAERAALDASLTTARNDRREQIAQAVRLRLTANLDTVVSDTDQQIETLRASHTRVSTSLEELNRREGPRFAGQPYALDEPIGPRPWLASAAGGGLGLLAALAGTGLLLRRWSREN